MRLEDYYIYEVRFKPQHAYTDTMGRVWKGKDLLKVAKDLPVFKLKITDDLLSERKMNWHINNFFDMKKHIERIKKVNLTEPVIKNKNGQVVDGWHRIMKAVLLGKSSVPCVQLTKDSPFDM